MVRCEEIESSEELAIEELDSGSKETDSDNVDVGSQDSDLAMEDWS